MVVLTVISFLRCQARRYCGSQTSDPRYCSRLGRSLHAESSHVSLKQTTSCSSAEACLWHERSGRLIVPLLLQQSKGMCEGPGFVNYSIRVVLVSRPASFQELDLDAALLDPDGGAFGRSEGPVAILVVFRPRRRNAWSRAAHCGPPVNREFNYWYIY